ncbi:MAG: Tfp pilus assembly protein PilF [Pedosphaera sp.]|nr:Tfp pilus assembly protein PilF [Pedosphaera sp.]
MIHRHLPSGRLLLALSFASLLFASPTLQARAADAVPDTGSVNQVRTKPNVKAWKKNRAAGKKARDEGEAQAAETFFRAALDEAQKFDATDYRLAASLQDLGALYAATENLSAAEPLLRRAATMRRQDPNFLAEAGCLIDFGTVCQKLGKNDEAEKAYLRAQEALELKLGLYHPYAVICMFHRAALYDDLKKDSLAEPLFKSVLLHCQTSVVGGGVMGTDTALFGGEAIPGPGFTPGGDNAARVIYRPNDACTLETLSRLGMLCARQNRLAEAESYFKQSLKMVENQAAKGSPSLEASLGRLVNVYLAQTNYAGAEAILKHSIRLQEKSLSPKHRNSFKPQATLASLYEKEQKIAEAEALHQHTVATAEKALGPDSDEAAETLLELARFYLAHGRYQEAEPLYRRLVARTEKYQGVGVALSPMLSDQAILYTKWGHDPELEAVYQRQIAIYEKMFGPNNKAVLKPLENYAALLHKKNRDSEAVLIEARVTGIQKAQAR